MNSRHPDDMWSLLTPRAQHVLALSRKEAERFHHHFVGTEHLLLGLIALGQGTAVNVLLKLGLNLEAVRDEVEKQVGTGPDKKALGHIPFTPRVKKVLDFAAEEARTLNHTYIGTEHILLGLLCDGEGVAARVLKHFEVDTEGVRLEILKELDPYKLHVAGEKRLLAPDDEAVDIAKRYDIYCAEGEQKTVVYHNARFIGRVSLLSGSSGDNGAEFIQLEQSNGQMVFVSPFTILKFCEHGGQPSDEAPPPA